MFFSKDRNRKFGKFDATAPFKFLKVDDIRAELNSRRVDTLGAKGCYKTERFTDLPRRTRLPALLFGPQQHSLDALNLQDHEVLFFEPLYTQPTFSQSCLCI